METKFTNSDNNEFANNILDTKVKEKELVNESDTCDFVKEAYFNEKLQNITKKAASIKQNIS